MRILTGEGNVQVRPVHRRLLSRGAPVRSIRRDCSVTAGVRRRESGATAGEIPGSHPLTRGPAHVVDPVERRIAAPKLVVELPRRPPDRGAPRRLAPPAPEKFRLGPFDRRPVGVVVRLAELPEGASERDQLRAALIEQHLPMVRYFARRYANRGEPMQDLLQAGSICLIKAVDRFDPRRGLEFSTYAAPTILGEIRRHFRDRTWAVHVHRGLQERSAEVARYATELAQELSRAPSVKELSARSGRTEEEEVLEALDVGAPYSTDSLETPAGEDRSIGGEDQALAGVELHESLAPALATLPERERRILQLRFFGNQTQSQIATQLGISQMHVSRLLAPPSPSSASNSPTDVPHSPGHARAGRR